MQWGGKEAANAFRLFLRTCPFILLVWPSGELMSSFLSKCSGPASAAERGLRVALAGTQITGLDRYHGFWNMRLWASHVLARGAGASDVVRDMWKLSWVYPAQPSLVPVGRESRHQDTETCIQTDKHGNPVSCVPTLILDFKCKVVGHAKNASCLPPPEPALAKTSSSVDRLRTRASKSQLSRQKSKGWPNGHRRFPRFFGWSLRTVHC